MHGRHPALFELVGRPPPDNANPLALWRALRLLGDHLEPALERFHAVPAKFEIVEACAPRRVQVAVVQARDQSSPARVDFVRRIALPLGDGAVVSHGYKLSVFDGIPHDEVRGVGGLCAMRPKQTGAQHRDKLGEAEKRFHCWCGAEALT